AGGDGRDLRAAAAERNQSGPGCFGQRGCRHPSVASGGVSAHIAAGRCRLQLTARNRHHRNSALPRRRAGGAGADGTGLRLRMSPASGGGSRGGGCVGGEGRGGRWRRQCGRQYRR
ncbi:unnamed protein product, partial [Phaeothamnion confervicola]